MSKKSGKYAYVNGVKCTQGWSSSVSSSLSRYYASCVAGASGVTPGNKDETGSFKGLGFAPPLPDGNVFDFKGVVSVSPILNWVGNVYITDVTLNIPVAAGGPINWTANFGADGLLTKDTSTAYEDASVDAAPSAKYGQVQIETAEGVWTAVDRPQNIVLTFRAPAATSVNSGVTEREGGNLEVDITVDVHNDMRDVAMYEPNVVKRVRVYVSATEFFEFANITWGGKTNFNVDRSSNPPAIIGYTINGMWGALSEGSTSLGYIKLPDDTYLFGEAPA